MTFLVIPKLGNYHRRYRLGQRIMTNSRNINLTQDYMLMEGAILSSSTSRELQRMMH